MAPPAADTGSTTTTVSTKSTTRTSRWRPLPRRTLGWAAGGLVAALGGAPGGRGARAADPEEPPPEPDNGDAPEAAPAAPAPDALARPVVALTFDAGADVGYAAAILDLLVDEAVPSSFGVTGRWAQANPDLVVRAGAEGHLLLNHTLSHRSFTGVSDRRGGLVPAARRAELEAADAILTPLLGRSPRPWYRLPYGDSDARVAADVAATGYTRHAGWTVDSLGWQGRPAGEIVARCLRLAAPGAVYLFHVGSASRDGPALGAILDGLRRQGYGFATLEGLGAVP